MSSIQVRVGAKRPVHTVQRRSRADLHVRKLSIDGRTFDTDNFLDNLQSMLFHAGGTQRDFAELAGLCPTTVANLVYHKTREPRATTLLKILAAQGIVLEAHAKKRG